MPTFVEIAVNVPQVVGTFHYHLPADLEGKVKTGALVTVPFGLQMVYGVVIREVDQPAVADTKAIHELVEEKAVITDDQIELAHWLASETLTPLAACIDLMLPPGLYQQADVLYELRSPQQKNAGQALSGLQARLFHLLEKRGPLRGRQIDSAIPRLDWRPTARSMVSSGVLRSRSVLPPPRVQPKFIRTARLACPPDVARDAYPSLGEPVRMLQALCDIKQAQAHHRDLARKGPADRETPAHARRWAMLEYLIQAGEPVTLKDLLHHTGGNTGDVDRLVGLNLLKVIERESPVMERRKSILEFLIREPGEIDVTWLYAESGGSLADLYFLEEHGLVILGESEVFRDPISGLDVVLAQPPVLTTDQQQIWNSIQKSLQNLFIQGEKPSARPILLHGVTGSGKTEIYLRTVQQVLLQGGQAIVLVPEIALTPQTVRRFISRFPGQVGLVHSALSPGERYDTWRRARQGSLSLVVGPRSALFTPFPNLKLIIIDEFHDSTYYQSDGKPHYHARETAVAYARILGGICLMGSATPDVVSLMLAKGNQWLSQGDQRKNDQAKIAEDASQSVYQYLQLPNRVLAHQDAVRNQVERLSAAGKLPTRPLPVESLGFGQENFPAARYTHLEAQVETIDLPPVEIVDMRDELKSGNRSIFSRELLSGLANVLNQEEQAILFLNRRGSATYVFCRDCGYTVTCPQCELPLTFHQYPADVFHKSIPDSPPPQSDERRLVCHYCGYTRKMPDQCPECKGKHIRQYGTGTEKVAAEVQKHFPEARVLRWDWETTRQKGAHDLILGHFAAQRADVLVGTQMLAKGLDLPLVTLVGVVLADVGLTLPDYSANERTFQVLMQVSGRAGRSPLGGKVIMQTFKPDHFVIQTVAKHAYLDFARQELANRRRLGYPPFANLVRLEYRHTDPKQAEKAARQMAEQLKTWIREDDRRSTRLLGPYPPFFARLGGLYRWHLVLRGPQPASMLRPETRFRQLTDWHIEVNAPSLL